MQTLFATALDLIARLDRDRRLPAAIDATYRRAEIAQRNADQLVLPIEFAQH
jgi:hypothetical protein